MPVNFVYSYLTIQKITCQPQKFVFFMAPKFATRLNYLKPVLVSKLNNLSWHEYIRFVTNPLL